MFKKSLLLTATFGLIASVLVAPTGYTQQNYNYNLNGTITFDNQSEDLRTTIWMAQQLAASYVVEFRNMWVYQMSAPKREFLLRAVPGLYGAIRANDWSAALSYYNSSIKAELAYTKYYHRPFSPAWESAYRIVCAKYKVTTF